MTKQILELGARALSTIRAHGPITLCPQRGVVWVTQEGDFSDRVVGAGDVLRLPGNAATVIQALGAPATVTACFRRTAEERARAG